ncbi:arabinogalactan endo-1,4-beta-galactosidase [Roridomyces roridus]|uniref:Arabinogalactan endo-beta-1,4-galactanase n=1 Tax=Roridomyces roridus TaxID=1738132 RepID=A0AAD7BZW3_9AGAR|nr:arabinogalactan endo-1,4-beta-galactosidase [Roridomyces roridus]
MYFSRLAVFLALSAVSRVTHALTYHCADFSSVINLENSGTSYKDSGTTAKLETILHNHGTNLARIRVWTSTNNADYSLTYGLQLAKRAVAAGMQIYVDLHFSDTWADPGHQAIPSGWPTTLAGLNTQVFTYTQNLVKSFISNGTPIQFLSIGNEINNGFLWPVGEISVNGYSGLSQMLHSAVSGARSASSSLRTIIHLANGWDAASVASFYNQIFIAGELSLADVDVMGFSFYPFYGTGATTSALQSSLQAMITKYGKDVMTWVADIRTVLQNLSGGHGLGICYWEPAWIGNAGLGSSCADNLLVDGSGNTQGIHRDVLRRHVVKRIECIFEYYCT